MDAKKLTLKNGTTVFYTTELRSAEHTRFYNTPTPRLTLVF